MRRAAIQAVNSPCSDVILGRPGHVSGARLVACTATNAAMSGTSSTPTDLDILVQGYSTRYAAAIKKLLLIEGGFVDDPLDRGGATKFGISLRFLAVAGAFDSDGDGIADFDLDMDGDIDGVDIRKLTRGDAVYLYLKHFWEPLGADSLPVPIGEMLFDQGVNGGLTAARKLLQRAINTGLLLIPVSTAKKSLLKVDGGIGDITMAALRKVVQSNSFGVTGLVSAYRDAVRERYRNIVARYPEQKRFLNGWLARAEQLGR